MVQHHAEICRSSKANRRRKINVNGKYNGIKGRASQIGKLHLYIADIWLENVATSQKSCVKRNHFVYIKSAAATKKKLLPQRDKIRGSQKTHLNLFQLIIYFLIVWQPLDSYAVGCSLKSELKIVCRREKLIVLLLGNVWKSLVNKCKLKLYV